MAFVRDLFRRPLYWLLLVLPLAVGLSAAGAPPAITLLASALAIVPLAGLLGEATEVLAAYTGPRIGGLLNATLGNAAELIITVLAIRQGLLELVKASITGSIIGNLLLVLGVSMLAGGWRHGLQTFDRRRALGDCILLLLAVAALAVPSLFVQTSGGIHDPGDVEVLSLGVALLMIVIYGLGLFYSLRGNGAPLTRAAAEIPQAHGAPWSRTTSLIVLALATVGVVWMSEILVGQVEPVVASLGVSEFFLGVILVPIIGNVAEHLVAVSVALKNQMSLSVEIAVGSSLQVALFVAPVLVFLSLALGNPLTLVFNSFELIALIGTVVIVSQVAGDGESNWLEGAELVALYLIFAIAFFLLPSV
ncbi:MAG TPA: calcium/proton exchanger [Anaerolineales bacterium]|nr:calcium/proton exchanger [Anaerolineales bacterium]